ncbi:hypothetical protein CYG48_09625 [Neorhizobium sp. SOG26]|nr:hypothetical protein CYG48_09625 [Neorhizobium sp. SOG26]
MGRLTIEIVPPQPAFAPCICLCGRPSEVSVQQAGDVSFEPAGNPPERAFEQALKLCHHRLLYVQVRIRTRRNMREKLQQTVDQFSDMIARSYRQHL